MKVHFWSDFYVIIININHKQLLNCQFI